MWIDNNDRKQEQDFTIKVESELKGMESGKVSKKQGDFRGRNTFGGNAFTLTYSLFQASSDDHSVAELYYAISSNDKWESDFDGDMMIDFGKDAVEHFNSVTISKDTKNTFFGYSLLAKKKGEIKSRELRKFLRQLLRAYSDVNIHAGDDTNGAEQKGKINKRDAAGEPKAQWWHWW